MKYNRFACQINCVVVLIVCQLLIASSFCDNTSSAPRPPLGVRVGHYFHLSQFLHCSPSLIYCNMNISISVRVGIGNGNSAKWLSSFYCHFVHVRVKKC
jgi:hypothetical protein